MVYHQINVKAPITDPAQVQIRARAVLIQNMGTLDAYINTHLTIRAGASLQIAPFPDNGVFYDDWTITFAAGAGTRRLEIVEVQNDRIIC
jgi:hypothetical protein